MKKESKFKPSYKKDFLDVGDSHKLYYELYGNPKGIPVLFLHGGPGAGFEEKHKRFFNPEIYNVIFLDQRGAGKSTPFATTKNNTTDDLVEDINMLLDHLGIEKVLIFGGSWGSTLGLVYAISNINRVSGLILYSIYLARKEDEEYLYGGGIKDYFYKDWERFVSKVPEEKRDNIIEYYLDQMNCGDEKREKEYAYELCFYESSLLHLRPNYKKIEKDLKEYDPKALSILEAYYAKNHNFIPENYILENAKVLKNISVYLVHGRYDMVCKPSGAYKLHEVIYGSKLEMVVSGHSSSEPAMNKALIATMKNLEK